MKFVSPYLDRSLRSVAEAQEQRRRRTGAAKTHGGEATAGDRDTPRRGRHAPPNMAHTIAGRAPLVTEDDYG